ncbi:hypothetical protein [Spongiimicrobium salis]|uniref:hypothetical protein n=1 Tax=Spongiimicrobium salis TaxID=1667022 RepID=UPI00374D7952
MNDIVTLYHNAFGVAFYWKRNEVPLTKRIQIIFRDTGLLITPRELNIFAQLILQARKEGTACENCPMNENCRSWLVNTPAAQITLAMNAKELDAIEDLVEGTLFQLGLNAMLGKLL